MVSISFAQLNELCENSRNKLLNKGDIKMKTYKLTAFEANGEKILDESFQAENDDSAKN